MGTVPAARAPTRARAIISGGFCHHAFGPGIERHSKSGAEAFAARMHALEVDRDALVAAIPSRLAHAVERFVTLSSPPQSLALDMGPFGALLLDRVTAPEWEPHVHARFEARHGDASWCAPDPELFVSPFAQQQLVADFLARAFAAADSETPLTLEWPRGASNQSPLVIRRLGVDPARFTAGFQPARATDLHETPATYVFVGANLVIVTAEASRVSFRFAVPPGLAEQEPFVSGWWTARSGERFALVLRVGTQVWRFDIGGHLLEAQR